MNKVSLLLLSIFSINSFALKINTDNFELYGKVALVSSIDFENGSQGLGDNSSRLGIKYFQDDIYTDIRIGLRGEWAISTNRNNSGFGSSNFDGKQYDVVSNDGPFGNRLGYLWLSKGNFYIAAGKMWSVFYDIPEFSDLFYTDGARASSVYTITGEVDGTYRASEIVQARYNIGKYHFAIQTKLTGKESVEYDFDSDGTAESTLVYKQVQAASIRYLGDNIQYGVSAINLMFDNNGESESQLSLSYGLKLKYRDFFLNSVFTRAKDLELNTNNNTFVHSDGTEIILGKNFLKNKQIMLGLNHQSRSESGQFDLKYYYFSYSMSVANFNYAIEYIHGDNTDEAGLKLEEKTLKLAATLAF